MTTTEIRNSLAAFMFYGEDVFKKISMLSGGEKVRLELAKILKKGPNLLILDEPTNHMDIVGKESLERLLEEYKGTILVVSHDRFFINKVTDSLLVFSKQGVKFFDGSYEKYEEERIEEQTEKVQAVKKEKSSNNLYLQQKEQARKDARIKKIEKEIDANDKQITDLKLELQKEEVYTNYEKLTEVQGQIEVLEEKNNGLMEEWELLEK